MNDLFDPKQDDSINRSSARQNGIRPVARTSPTDAQTSDNCGPGSFNSVHSSLGEQRFAMIAAYSFVILLALGYVPGLTF